MGLLDTIQNVTRNELESRPSAVMGVVTAYYDGSCTVRTDGGTLENIKCVTPPMIEGPCVVVPVGEDMVCVPNVDGYTRKQIDDIIEDIISGDIDLSNYIKKDEFLNLFEVDFDMSLGNPLLPNGDSFTLDIFLKRSDNNE